MSVDRPGWAPEEIDPTRPSVARVYDFYLGGSHNFESDREFGRQALQAMPHLPTILRDNRDFLRRVVLHLSELGIGQFLDLGRGSRRSATSTRWPRGSTRGPRSSTSTTTRWPSPTAPPCSAATGGRCRGRCAGARPRPGAAVATGLLDLDRPVAVLLVAVLHFIQDEDRPAELIGRYMAAAAPGSYLAMSHARLDGQPECAPPRGSTTGHGRRTPCACGPARRSRPCSRPPPWRNPGWC